LLVLFGFSSALFSQASDAPSPLADYFRIEKARLASRALVWTRGVTQPTKLVVALGGAPGLTPAGEASAPIDPRGAVGAAWPEPQDVQVRRRFFLLGRSLEAAQVADVRAGLAALRSVAELAAAPIELEASGAFAIVAVLAATSVPSVRALVRARPPASLAGAGSYPNALRYFDLPQLPVLALPRSITIRGSRPELCRWTADAAKVAGGAVKIQ